MMIRQQLLSCLLLSLCMGCSSQPAPVLGGTAGKLLLGTETTSEIMIHIGRRNGNVTTELGFGVTNDHGEFSLLLPGATGPLVLEQGEYTVWLESIGPPVQLPKDCQTAARSPLKLQCQDPARLPDLQIEISSRKP